MESDINKNLTDEQLDDLIRQSFHRQQTVEEINISVMKQLHQSTRRRYVLRWVRIVAFAFGLPLMLLLFAWLLWSSVSQQGAVEYSIFGQQLSVFTCLLIPIATMIYATWRAIVNFSPNKV